jgi:hypothetical protein
MPSTTRARPVLLLALLLACATAVSAGETQRGHVYADGNGNGIRDAGETGTAGVALSNGVDVVRSDAQGRYALPIAPWQTAFVIKPAGWRFPLRGDGLPAFWRHHVPEAGSQRLRYGGLAATGVLPREVDFALRADTMPPSRQRDGLRALVVADPQPKSAVDVDHYARDIVAPIRGEMTRDDVRDADVGLTLGDVTSDDLSLYPALNRVTAALGLPWMHAPGNHDLDFDAARDEDSLDSFRQAYGPDSYAWEEPEAVFVMLDDVVYRPGETPAYAGGLREAQFAFLESYLSTVPKDRLLVLALHIPLFDTAAPGKPETFRSADRARLFALLQGFPHVLVLSGHRHTQQHYFHDADDGWQGATPLHEYNVGAASGAFWSGAPDADGIPDATMADGTPNGHARLQVAADGAYRLSWHPARRPHDDPAFTDAMALHAPKVLRRGAYPAWGVYANVFMGFDGSRVEYRVDGGEWKPMTQVARPDPRLLAENARDDVADALRGYDRSPEAEPSPHLWRGALPTGLAEGEHIVEVRAFDRWQGEQRASTHYRLQHAEP